jgi:hypothetical protein
MRAVYFQKPFDTRLCSKYTSTSRQGHSRHSEGFCGLLQVRQGKCRGTALKGLSHRAFSKLLKCAYTHLTIVHNVQPDFIQPCFISWACAALSFSVIATSAFPTFIYICFILGFLRTF